MTSKEKDIRPMHRKIIRMSRVALFTAFLTICAQISVPLPIGIPFTLQVFAVALLAFSLTPGEAVTTISVYIGMGLLGLPVFAGQRGGVIATVGSPTFGFILGFIPMVLGMGLLWWRTLRQCEKNPAPEQKKWSFLKIRGAFFASCIGLVLLYFFGLGIVSINANITTGESMALTGLLWTFLPFFLLDIVKVALAVFVSSRLTAVLGKIQA